MSSAADARDSNVSSPEIARSAPATRIGFGAALLLAMTVSTFMIAAFGALGPVIRTDLELSRGALGALTTVMFAVGAGLSPVAGRMADEVGGRRLLVTLFVAAGVAFAAAAAAPTYPLLIIACCIFGLSLAAGNPSTNKLIVEYLPIGRQGMITGIKQSGVQVGIFAAGALLPPTALWLGWRGALLASIVLPTAGLVLARLFVPPDRPSSSRPQRRKVASTLGPVVSRLAAYAFLMGMGVAGYGAYLPLYSHEVLGLSVSVSGLTVALSGLVGIGARVLWGRAAEHTIPTPVALSVIAAGSVVAQALIWGARGAGVGLVWAGALVTGLSAASWNAVGMLEIVRGLEPGRAGRASGIVLLAFYGGNVISPLAFGLSVDWSGAYDLGWGALMTVYVSALFVASAWALKARRGGI
ncbi:MAG: MFS transporter [Actinomycetota bacterium]|nr:MFS transporter [Actinomycetota bacterium]